MIQYRLPVEFQAQGVGSSIGMNHWHGGLTFCYLLSCSTKFGASGIKCDRRSGTRLPVMLDWNERKWRVPWPPKEVKLIGSELNLI